VAVSRSEVLRIAALARLEIADDEAERMAEDLTAILRHVEDLTEAELGPAAPDTISGAAPLRDDVAGAAPLSRPVSEIAPAWRDGFFTVPRLVAMADANEPGDDAS
jgi:aspartyl-tRNA(Asn)/glutamyl-tRNA(Gln) amidotransferase subunit C